MEELFLTVEQCRNLQALGLDMSDAKFCWVSGYGRIFVMGNPKAPSNIKIIIPTYSLQELWSLLPKSIFDECGICYDLILTSASSISYSIISTLEEGHFYSFYKVKGENILLSAYETLCWCLEKGYIK